MPKGSPDGGGRLLDWWVHLGCALWRGNVRRQCSIGVRGVNEMGFKPVAPDFTTSELEMIGNSIGVTLDWGSINELNSGGNKKIIICNLSV